MACVGVVDVAQLLRLVADCNVVAHGAAARSAAARSAAARSAAVHSEAARSAAVRSVAARSAAARSAAARSVAARGVAARGVAARGVAARCVALCRAAMRAAMRAHVSPVPASDYQTLCPVHAELLLSDLGMVAAPAFCCLLLPAADVAAVTLSLHFVYLSLVGHADVSALPARC